MSAAPALTTAPATFDAASAKFFAAAAPATNRCPVVAVLSPASFSASVPFFFHFFRRRLHQSRASSVAQYRSSPQPSPLL
jgi:hypothetical protein